MTSRREIIDYCKANKIKFEAGELTELEYDFFTKVDNGETNYLELHYDGFIIASGRFCVWVVGLRFIPVTTLGVASDHGTFSLLYIFFPV